MLMFLIYVKDSHVRWWHDGETLKDEGHKHYFDKTFIIISSFDICTKLKFLKNVCLSLLRRVHNSQNSFI